MSPGDSLTVREQPRHAAGSIQFDDPSIDYYLAWAPPPDDFKDWNFKQSVTIGLSRAPVTQPKVEGLTSKPIRC